MNSSVAKDKRCPCRGFQRLPGACLASSSSLQQQWACAAIQCWTWLRRAISGQRWPRYPFTYRTFLSAEMAHLYSSAASPCCSPCLLELLLACCCRAVLERAPPLPIDSNERDVWPAGADMSWLHADSATVDQEPTLAERARAIQTRQPIPGFCVHAQGNLSQLHFLHPDICLLTQTCLIPDLPDPNQASPGGPGLLARAGRYDPKLHLAC